MSDGTGLPSGAYDAVREHGRWVTGLLTFAVFVGTVAYADVGRLTAALSNVDAATLGLAVALPTVGYGLRFLKWELYLRELEIDVPVGTSLVVFLSGLMMVVTPGKAGEVWKAWFLNDLEDVPMNPTTSVVGAERATDLLALGTMALVGAAVYRHANAVAVAVVGLLVVGFVALQWREGCLRFLEWLEGLPAVGDHAPAIATFYENTYALFQLRPLIAATLLSLAAWGLEGVALWILLEGFGVQAPLVLGVFVFGLGSIVGALSMLPGGLVAAEASMVGLLLSFGYGRAVAVGATLLVRATTLWYAALLGFLVFSAHGALRRRTDANGEES